MTSICPLPPFEEIFNIPSFAPLQVICVAEIFGLKGSGSVIVMVSLSEPPHKLSVTVTIYVHALNEEIV